MVKKRLLKIMRKFVGTNCTTALQTGHFLYLLFNVIFKVQYNEKKSDKLNVSNRLITEQI